MENNIKIHRLKDLHKSFGRFLETKKGRKLYSELYTIVSENRGIQFRNVVIMIVIIMIPILIVYRGMFYFKDVFEDNLLLCLIPALFMLIILFKLTTAMMSKQIDGIEIASLNQSCKKTAEMYFLKISEKHKQFLKKHEGDAFEQDILSH